jgi:FkbM family methyltransferase
MMVQKYFADGGDYVFRFNYNLTQESLVLDLGGYEGQWASDLYARYRCKIIVFEPVKGFAERIQKRFLKNPDITVLQFGLGKTSRAETIGICADGSSIFKNSNQKEQIQIFDVKDYITSHSQIDLMKVNIEGGEYELLERLIETNLCRTISNIQVQFHYISNESSDRMEQIQKRLKETHHLTYQYRFVWENWTRNDL